jgi:hypothetical protein
MNHRIRTTFVALTAALAATAQMEKRENELYATMGFATAEPMVGAAAPDLRLCDVDGRPRALRAWLGRTVVLVKGSFT